ncbi:MAG: hypothetical protein RhofKO_27760 [Rhodothermales bacterium]
MLDPLKTRTHDASYTDVAQWLRRIETRQAHHPRPARAPLIAVLVVTLLSLGFVTFTEDEVVGHVLIVDTAGPPDGLDLGSLSEMLDGKVMSLPHPTLNQSRHLIIIDPTVNLTADAITLELPTDQELHIAAEHTFTESFDRNAYQALVANLPSSLERYWGWDVRTLDLQLFMDHLRQLIEHEIKPVYGSYGFSRSSDSTGVTRYQFGARSGGDIASERLDLFERHGDAEKALTLLSDTTNARILEARHLITAYHDSLSARIEGRQ